MYTTNSPGDKFAFLFRTDNTYDLTPVKDVLSLKYGYSVYQHSDSSGNFAIEGSDFLSEFNSFAQSVEAHPATGDTLAAGTPKNTVAIFIVGEADITGLANSAADGNTLGWTFLKDALSGSFGPMGTHDYLSGSEVHIACITPFCNELKSLFDFVDDGTLLVPQTAMDALVVTQSVFISSWATIVSLADTSVLNSQGFLTFESIASKIHAGAINGTNPLTSWFTVFSGGVEVTTVDITEASWIPYYIGLPKLLINDGSPSWWNSPDIWITNSIHNTEGNAYYEANASNDVHIRIFNQGCHPLTRVYVGATLFPFGGGGSPGIVNVPPRLISNLMVLNGDSHTYFYAQLFGDPYVHRCIKARASFNDISDADIADDTDWAPTIYDYEAQKNLNPATISGSGGGAGEAPGGGALPEPPPGDDPDPGGDGEKTVDNLRDFKEEEILIMNPFKEKRRFRLVVSDEIRKYDDILNLQLFTFNSKEPHKIYPLVTSKKSYPRATFTLLPGQELNLMAYIGLRKGVVEVKDLAVSIEVLIEKRLSDRFFRIPTLRTFKNRFSSFSGVTLLVKTDSVDLRFEIVNGKKRPASGALVYLSTLNGRQAAILKSNEKGLVHFKRINPGPYYVTAVGRKTRSERIIINAYPGQRIKEPHKLVLAE